jgi:hypothetical protein
MTAHSPGPWRWTGGALRAPDSSPVLDINLPAEAAHFVVRDADARLIAAAPELLAALRERVDACTDCVSVELRCPECQADRALIRRIEGEAGT